MRLEEFGWEDRFARAFEPWASKPDVFPARVAIEFNHMYRLVAEAGDVEAVITGGLKHRAATRGELPAVGDWVVARQRPGGDRAAIVSVLPRKSKFSRRMAGQVTDEQVVAANVDIVFIVMALDSDFSVRRLERYLLLARESGASPVVLLTKPDLCEAVAARVANVDAAAGGAPVLVLKPKFNEGLEPLQRYLAPGRTCALLGSSGVGKSTIINRLAGNERQRTRDVRESDSKGRHTTTHRELIQLPGGGLVIDTPGMRELQLWDVGDAVRETFEDVESLAAGCHFSDCRHRDEPRCAVKAAVADGRVAPERLESYLRLQDEIASLAQQQDERAHQEEKRRTKAAGKVPKPHFKPKG